jgi:hypothetical protein
MGRIQKGIIIGGLALVLLMGLFPPYVGTHLREGDNLSRFVGYYSLFFPPTPKQVFQGIHGDPWPSYYGHREECNYMSRVDMERLVIQVTCCVAVFSAVLVSLRPKMGKRRSSGI